jgi:acetolactate decarboxylase
MRDDHLHALRRSLVHGPRHGEVEQAGTASQLFAGYFEGIATVEEEFGSARLGIGVMHDLDGEVVSINGTTWAIPSSGTPQIVAPSDTIAFGISAHGGTRHELAIEPGADLEGIQQAIDKTLSALHEDHDHMVCAVSIKGSFRDVLLRTVHHPDYEGETLGEIIDDEIRFAFDQWQGSVVGFRYPDHSTGQTIPGLHLHALASDLLSGGHVRNITAEKVTAELWVDDLHITGGDDASGDEVDFERYEGPVSPTQ